MNADDTAIGPFGRAAQIYRAAGWLGTLPLGYDHARAAWRPGQKYPPPRGWTGHGAPYPSGPDLAAWIDDPTASAANIGIRMPEGVIGLDVDAGYGGKTGDRTIAELEQQWGPLPPTWVSSARPAPSGIRWYRVPAGINWPGEAGKFVEIIQQGHRYAVVWPSTNPEADGAEYAWRGPDGETLVNDLPHPAQLAHLPQPWVEGLARQYAVAGKADLGNGAQAQWVSKLRGGDPCPPIAATLDRALATLRDKDNARHEAARDALSAIVRSGGEGHRGSAVAVGRLGAAFAEAVGAERMQNGEWDRLVVGAVKIAAAANPEPLQMCPHDIPPATSGAALTVPEGFSMPAAGTASPLAADIAAGALTLPDEFWRSRDSLQRIRQAAHARVRSGDVVLAGVLARLAAMVPRTLRADTGIGSPACLNLFTAIVGPSGSGKSSGVSVSRNIIKSERALEEFPLGSGEGIAEAFMGEALEGTGQMAKDGSEKQQKVRKQVRYNALFHSDEGAALNKLIERAGSTVGETLRTAWSGETIGQKNGRAETTRSVPAGSYSCGLVIGYQPETVLPLLDDAAAGTPQRFLYVWAIDPTIPGRGERIPWPGEVVSPFPADVPTDMPAPGMLVPAPKLNEDPITFAGEILDELYDLEHAKSTGTLPAEHPLRDEFRSQHTMLKIKVAALLALLESRRRVSPEDWRLAQIILDTSDTVRITLQKLGAAAARDEARRADEAHARRAVMAHAAIGQHEASEVSTAVSRLAAALAGKVAAAGAEGLMRSAARKTVASTSRPLFGDALTLAVDMAWIVEDGARLRMGASMPALGGGSG